MTKSFNYTLSLFLITTLLVACNNKSCDDNPDHIVLEDQGSFFAGGKMIKNPGIFDHIKRTSDGQTYHGDHCYISYQIPVNARKFPLVMWHGYGQSSKTWETTPDGREGFQNIFLKRRYPVYLIDQPRRGKAGRSMEEAIISPIPDEQFWFNVFRIGVWPEYFEGVQFARDEETLDQYFRQMTPDIGPINIDLNVQSVSAAIDEIGPSILITHSHSGGMGWKTAINNENVKGIISYEPGSGFVFPFEVIPEPLESSAGALEATGVSKEDFMKLLKIPIIIYYGDNIPANPDINPGTDGWRVRLQMAMKWRDIMNSYGGDVTVIHLPLIGVEGNTHFPFSDLNNIEIADLMTQWLKEKELDELAH